VGLLLAVEHSRTAPEGATNKGTVEAAFDERTMYTMDSDRSKVQSSADLLVRLARAKAAATGL